MSKRSLLIVLGQRKRPENFAEFITVEIAASVFMFGQMDGFMYIKGWSAIVEFKEGGCGRGGRQMVKVTGGMGVDFDDGVV